MSARWRVWRVVRVAAVLVAAVTMRAQAGDSFLIHDGDTVAFVGDSITEHGRFINYVGEYLAVRWPQWHVELADRGVFGNRAPDAVLRLPRDVIASRPQLALLFFGVNDGRYQSFKPEFLSGYTAALRQMVTRLQAAGIRPALVTPTVIDPDELKGYQGDAAEYNEVLGRYAQAVAEIGRELAVPVLDVYGALRQAQQQAKAAQPGFTMFPGGVHPSAAGHLLIAARLLRDLGAPPVVSTAEIDAAKGTVVAADGCTLQGVSARAGAVSFTRQEERGWWHIDPEARSVLPWAPDVRALDTVSLIVHGLPAGTYRVLLDGQALEPTVSAERLAQGLFLPEMTPADWPPVLAALAQRVAARQRVARLRWDPLQLSLPDGPETTEILAQLDRLLGRLRAEITALPPPVAAQWVIIPVRGAP